MIRESPARDAPVHEDAVRQDLVRTLAKVRRARRLGDLAADLIQTGRASALNRQLRRLRSLRRRRHEERPAA